MSVCPSALFSAEMQQGFVLLKQRGLGFGAELGWLGLGINNAGSGHDWGAHSYFTAIKHAEINLIPPSFWLNWKWSPDFKRFVHVFQLNLFRSLETFSLKTATTSRYTRGRWCSNTKYREVAPSADHLLLLNARGPNLDSALKLPSSSSYSYSSSLGPDSSHNRITADGGNYHLNTYFRHEKQPQLRQNVLSRRYFSLMMFFLYLFFLWCICSFQRKTEPTVTEMKNEREGASEINLRQE